MAKRKMVIWALFDSGNGCYIQASKNFSELKVYSIGIDIEKKNHHFIKLNLADYSKLFGNSLLFRRLDRLPKPDVIMASPPCESFSVANSMWGGNASWKQEDKKGSRFVIRARKDYELPQVPRRHFRYDKSFLNRVNGELCIYNTIEIIKRYQPKVYVIENPYSSRIWDYIDKILDFQIPFENPTYYGNYGYPVKKPTKFKSNIVLDLKFNNYYSGTKMSKMLTSYNARSNIPIPLIQEMYRAIIKYCQQDF